MSVNPQQISEICTACGMCCDGTLFHQANIRHDDDKAVAETLGLTTDQKNDRRFFRLPCHHFSWHCTIYEQQRPHICGAYFCDPIIKTKRQQMPLSEASAMITRAVQLNRQFQNGRVNFSEFSDMSVLQIQHELHFDHLPSEQQVAMRKKICPAAADRSPALSVDSRNHRPAPE